MTNSIIVAIVIAVVVLVLLVGIPWWILFRKIQGISEGIKKAVKLLKEK